MGKHRTPEKPPHDCPAGCGKQVQHGHIACDSCWYLLPAELRQRIRNGDRPTHLAAWQEALVWYRNNTAGGVPL